MVLDPLAQIDPFAIAGVAATFLVTYLLLRRACLAPLVEVMERRAHRTAAARAGKAEAETILQDARAEAERKACLEHKSLGKGNDQHQDAGRQNDAV